MKSFLLFISNDVDALIEQGSEFRYQIQNNLNGPHRITFLDVRPVNQLEKLIGIPSYDEYVDLAQSLNHGGFAIQLNSELLCAS